MFKRTFLRGIVLSICACFLFAQTGNLSIKIKNVNGSSVSGAKVIRYNNSWNYLDYRTTNSIGDVYWANIPTGTYNLEAYYTGTFFGEEFWASEAATVNTGSTTSKTLQRNYPYASSVTIKNNSTGAVISPGQNIAPGTVLRAEVVVRNNVPSTSFGVRVRFLFDINKISSYNYDSGLSATQTVSGSGGTKTYTFTYTANSGGQYYYALEVKPTLANGNVVRTDSWTWTQTAKVAIPTVSVSTPNGGENWTIGTTKTITATSTGSITGVQIHYSTNSGSTWTSITSYSTTNNNISYNWTVPNAPSISCRIKVTVTYSGGSVSDVSNSNFTISVPSGNLNATIKNVNGTTVSGAIVKRYSSNWAYIDQKTTNSSGVASWSNIPTGTYNLEASYTGTFFGEEFWASEAATINTGSTTSKTLQRNYPYASSVTIKNNSTGAVISPGQNIAPGTVLRAEVVVRNNVPSTSFGVKVRFLFDINKTSPYNYDSGLSATQTVSGSGGTKTYTFTYNASTEGQYYYALEVKPTLANGNVVRTDSWTWTQTAKVAIPTVSVSTPNGGENWTIGTTKTITATSTGSITGVQIHYSTNSGSTWTSITSYSTTNNNISYNWTVPNAPSISCRIKVTVTYSGGSVSDVSNSNFTISVPSGNLNATIKNVNGTTVSGAIVKRYSSNWAYIDQKTTNSSGVASWSNIPTGTYNLEASYTGTFFGEEFWASEAATINTGSTTSKTLQRNYPYASSVTIKNNSTGAVISPGQNIAPGTVLRAEVVVRNNVPSTSFGVKVRFLFDINKTSPYNYDSGLSATQTVSGSGGTKTYTFTYNASTEGQYYYALEVKPTLANGNVVRTDSWTWTETFHVTLPKGDLKVTVQNINGEERPNAIVRRYTSNWTYIDNITTNTTGDAYWYDISAETYNLEAYYTGTFFGEEFWVSDNVDVINWTTTNKTLRRNCPYANKVIIKNVSTNQEIFPGDFIEQGTQVHAIVTVQNDIPSTDLYSQVQLIFDRNKSSSYDHDSNLSSKKLIYGNGNTNDFDFYFIINDEGQYYYALQVKTTLANGNVALTDSWDWTETFNINRKQAQIIDFNPPNGTYQRSTNAQTTITVKNTSTETRSFWVGLSFAQENATWEGWPQGWYDIKAKQTKILSPDESQELTFSFILPENLKPGQYYAVSKIWNGFNSTDWLMIGPTYDETLLYSEWNDNELGTTSFYLGEYDTPPDDIIGQLLWGAKNIAFEGQDLMDIYVNDGQKPLLYFNTNISGNLSTAGVPLEFSGGATFLIDLNDLFQMTPEGKDGWVTMWIDADGSLGLGAGLPVEIGGEMGITYHNFDYNERAIADDRRAWGANLGASIAGFAITLVDYRSDGGIQKPSIHWTGSAGITVNISGTANSLVSWEVNVNDLKNAFTQAFSNDRNLHQSISSLSESFNGMASDMFRVATWDDGSWQLTDAQWVSDLKLSKTWNNDDKYAHYFYLDVPSNSDTLHIITNGGMPNGDIYVKFNEPPLTSYDYLSNNEGNEESVVIPNPNEGKWYIMIPAVTAYEGLNLVASTTSIQDIPFSIFVDISPNSGGNVSGIGNYNSGETCNLTATPNTGYYFVNWTENGTQISVNANYSFTVTSNRNLIANFAHYSVLNISSGDIAHDFGSVDQGNNPSIRTYTFTVKNTGTETLTGTVSESASWLSLSSSNFSLEENDTKLFTVTATTSDLSPDSHRSAISVISNGGNISGDVTVDVVASSEPNLSISSGSIDHNYGLVVQGNNPITQSYTFTVKNIGTGTLIGTVSDSVSWLTLSSTSFSLEENEEEIFNVTAITSSLSASTTPYSCEILVSSNGGSASGIADVFIQDTTNHHNDKMILVRGGTFQLGSNNGLTNEQPIHDVILNDFRIGKYTVTHEEYIEFLNDVGVSSDGLYSGVKVLEINDTANCAISFDEHFYFRGNLFTDDIYCPLKEVPWYGAIHYCNWLSVKEGLNEVYYINGTNVTANFANNGYRLPTEAEWEYAASGGKNSQGYIYSGSNTCSDVAWYKENAYDVGSEHDDYGIHPVGEKQPNELGLYDMSGNVWEWCWDWYGDYESAEQNNPIGLDSAIYRVMRGGNFYLSNNECRVSYRGYTYPDNHYGHTVCFRIAQSYNINEDSTSVKDIAEIDNFRLKQNYPNPFNPTTTLKYGLPETSDILLNIFDITGHKIKEWAFTNQQPGWHEVVWDGTGLNGNMVPTGVYIYSLRAGDYVVTKKMVFMK